MKKILLLPCMFIVFFAFAQQVSQKTFLVIFPHPDDETAIGHVLAKLSKENKVILITATDGRYGVKKHAAISQGDSLAAVRKKEVECSCKKLGIDSLITLGYHDGMGVVTGVGEYFRQTKSLRDTLIKIIDKINPNFILTFGPDGDTGHSDHRNTGNIITEILLRESWVDRFPLYYLAWRKEQSFVMGGLGYMAEEYLNVSIKYTDEDEQRNWEATRCHWSQFTPGELKELIAVDTKDKSNTIYFRRFVVQKGLQAGF
jgi:LmbE family N-acetylglucosaminyl deacetylase